ncbi:MAG: hypothetical protein J6R79_00125 [Bacteroidaceae bacterium]|nr:hypothetical protein [Bacteroidaceae bacterium]
MTSLIAKIGTWVGDGPTRKSAHTSQHHKKITLCHNAQTATLLINFGFSHVLQYTPFILNFSAPAFYTFLHN